jgi:DNA-binding transcriptional LysR family regulator
LQIQKRWNGCVDYVKTIESFVAVASFGSFSTAAEKMGLSRALVTRHIGDLETRLGARLLNRTSRRVALTDIGADYLPLARRILEALRAAELSTRRRTEALEGSLTVIAPKSFGSLHLADAIAKFALKHPTLRVVLMLDDVATRSLEIAQGDFDLALRLAPLQEKSGAIVRKLGTLRWVLCAAPSYLSQHGSPDTVAALGDHNCLLHSTLAADRMWRFASRKERVKVTGTFISNSVLAIRRAAIAGVGIAQLPTYYIAADLAEGRLVELLPLQPFAERPVFALLPGNRLIPKKTRLLISHLASWYRTKPWDAPSSGRF